MVAVLTLPSSSLAGEATIQRDLFIVAGQSNAVGYDAPASDLPADMADSDILFWWRCGDPPPDAHDTTSAGQWRRLQAQPRGNPLTEGERQFGNFRDASGGFGPEIGFARRLHATGRRLAVIKVAYSGTALHEPKDWNPGDPCYRALVDEVKAATDAATTAGVSLRPRAMLWIQGESDSLSEAAASGYEAALTRMIHALRRDLKAPDLIVMLAMNTEFLGGGPLVDQVAVAQKSVAKQLSRVLYVDTAGAQTANEAHFSAAGTLEVGRRFADALLALEREHVHLDLRRH